MNTVEERISELEERFEVQRNEMIKKYVRKETQTIESEYSTCV